jgi:nucleotide-binding universal stress UspA family protein
MAAEYPPDATWRHPDEADQITNDRVSVAQDELDRMAASLRDRGLDVRTLVRVGQAASEILRATLETEADLVVMASHGRGGLRRLLMGSVTTSVIQSAMVPLLVAPAETRARVPAPERRRAMATTTG